MLAFVARIGLTRATAPSLYETKHQTPNQARGKYDEAESLFTRALQVDEVCSALLALASSSRCNFSLCVSVHLRYRSRTVRYSCQFCPSKWLYVVGVEFCSHSSVATRLFKCCSFSPCHGAAGRRASGWSTLEWRRACTTWRRCCRLRGSTRNRTGSRRELCWLVCECPPIFPPALP